ELAVVGPDSGIAVERAEPHRSRLGGVWVLRPEMRPALRAERLAPAVGRPPRSHELVAFHGTPRAGGDARRRRRCGGGAPLSAAAVAVERRDERLVDLEAHAAAETATRQHRSHTLAVTCCQRPGGRSNSGSPPRTLTATRTSSPRRNAHVSSPATSGS